MPGWHQAHLWPNYANDNGWLWLLGTVKRRGGSMAMRSDKTGRSDPITMRVGTEARGIET